LFLIVFQRSQRQSKDASASKRQQQSSSSTTKRRRRRLATLSENDVRRQLRDLADPLPLYALSTTGSTTPPLVAHDSVEVCCLLAAFFRETPKTQLYRTLMQAKKAWCLAPYVYAPPRVQRNEWRAPAPRDLLARVPFARSTFRIDVLVCCFCLSALICFFCSIDCIGCN
jgi:hypothetical protein